MQVVYLYLGVETHPSPVSTSASTMDPFSTGAAAIGLIANGVTLVNYLLEVKEAIGTLDDDIEELINEVKALEKAHSQLRKECSRQSNRPSAGKHQRGMWSYVNQTMRLTETCVGKFKNELQQIYGANPKHQGLIDGLKKQIGRAHV